MRLHPDRIDAFLRPLAGGEVVQALDHALFLEVDGSGTAGLGHRETFGDVVDRDHLLGTEQNRAADAELADRPAAPDRHRVGGLDVALHDRLPTGREDVAEKQHLLVAEPVLNLDRADVGVGHAHVLCLAAGIAAGQVRVAEETCGGVAEDLVGQFLVAVGPLADREIPAPALLALAAGDRERHDDPVTDLELVVPRPDLDHFAHEFVAHDVAGFHAGHQAIVEMDVGAADRGARHPDDGIPRRLDLRIGDVVAADVGPAVPAQRAHAVPSSDREFDGRRAATHRRNLPVTWQAKGGSGRISARQDTLERVGTGPLPPAGHGSEQRWVLAWQRNPAAPIGGPQSGHTVILPEVRS